MKKIIIFLTQNKIFGRIVHDSDTADDIIIHGRSCTSCKTQADVDKFIKRLLKCFVVPSFKDDDFDIIILDCYANKELLRYLADKCNGSIILNIINIEKIMPLVVLNKQRFQSTGVIIAEFEGESFFITRNQHGDISVLRNKDINRNKDLNPIGSYRVYQPVAPLTPVYQPVAPLTPGTVCIQAVEIKIEDKDFYFLHAFSINKFKIGIGEEELATKESDIKRACDENTSITDELFKLGLSYANGNGVDQKYVTAVKIYEIAAKYGNSSAMNNLGCCYYSGNGVDQDFDVAAEWFRKAAEAGDQTAMYNLALCYKNGQGVVKDIIQEKEWLQKSAELGDEKAIKALADLGTFIG